MQSWHSTCVSLNRILAAAWDSAALPAAQEIAWSDVLRLAGPSNVAALVHRLTEPIRSRMPDDVRALLGQAFYRTVAANTRSLEQLSRLGAAIAASGTPMLLLKGAALAHSVYPDPNTRLFGDIDLAVPRSRVTQCRKVLLRMGYVPSRIEERPGSLLAYGNQEQLLPPHAWQSAVELHWHILDVPYYIQHVPMDWFWENVETAWIAGQAFAVLNVEANILYLSAHLALHHGFRGLHSLVDLALLIVRKREGLRWERVIETARQFDLVCALKGTLDLLASTWPDLELDEPRSLLLSIRPTQVDARLYALLASQPQSASRQFYARLVSLPGYGDRARYVAANLFPQPIYMKHRYNFQLDWLLPLFYANRLAQAAWRGVRLLLSGAGPRSNAED